MKRYFIISLCFITINAMEQQTSPEPCEWNTQDCVKDSNFQKKTSLEFLQTSCGKLGASMVKNNKLSRAIVDEANNPTKALLQLLKIMNIEHDGTLRTIVKETQKKWLRPAGQERWEEQNYFIYTNDTLSSLFEELYLTQEIKPLKQQYTYAVLLGGSISDIRNRLSYLIRLWKDGIRFETIIVFTGKRPLDQNIDSLELLLHNTHATLPFKQDWQVNGQLPYTETEMIKFIFNQIKTPKAWNAIPIVFVDTPMQKTENGNVRRPNTQDTINEWLTVYHPEPGSILALSHQPFIGYQGAVLRKSLPVDFVIDTVGDIDFENEGTATILDALARWIYNEER